MRSGRLALDLSDTEQTPNINYTEEPNRGQDGGMR
jgi:hypothetical protein